MASLWRFLHEMLSAVNVFLIFKSISTFSKKTFYKHHLKEHTPPMFSLTVVSFHIIPWKNSMMQPICKYKPKCSSVEVLNPLKKHCLYDCPYTHPPWPFRKLILLLDCSEHASPPPEKNSLQLPWKLSKMKPAALIPVAIFSLPPTSTST